MQSKWSTVKSKALSLRRNGNSLGFISTTLGIPKSTLSGWFKGLELSEAQKIKPDKNWRLRLALARKHAVVWHNTAKAERIEKAKINAITTLANIGVEKVETIELALALLYLGEGSKKSVDTAIGNSDPLILQFFITILRNIYNVPLEKIKADLHLRADQNAVQLRSYWAKTLKIPLINFKTVSHDKRTHGRPTYPGYKGVCLIRCGNVAIQRKLVFLSRLYCQKIIDKYLGG